MFSPPSLISSFHLQEAPHRSFFGTHEFPPPSLLGLGPMIKEIEITWTQPLQHFDS